MKLLDERRIRLDASLLRFRWRMFWLAWQRLCFKPVFKARRLWLKVRHRGRDFRFWWRFDVCWPLRYWWVSHRRSIGFFGMDTLLFGIAAFVLYGVLFGTLHQAAPGEAKAPPSEVWSLVRYGWAGYLFVSLLLPIWRGSAREHWHFFARIRPLIVLQNLAAWCGVIVCALSLAHFFPFLDRSWLYLLPPSGASGSATAGNIAVMPAQIPVIGLPFLALLVLNLPELALWEEKTFRQGTRNWLDAAKRSLIFGPVHCAMGVPLYVGLALSLAGMWFSYQYFRGGVERSTLHHLTYNLTALVVMGLVLFL